MNSRKTVLVLLAILLAWPVAGQYRRDYSDLNDSETVRSFKEHVNFLSSFALEGRAAGSPGERDAAAYVYGKLSEMGVEMLCPPEGDVFGIHRDSPDTLISRNVIGYIQGYDVALRDHFIVVGARLDNLGTHRMTVDGREVDQIYHGANGNASGVAMMLELARRIRTNSVLFRRSVLFVGFGASRQGLAGSWYFLNRSFKDFRHLDAMVNLDMLGGGSDTFQAYTASNEDMNTLISRSLEELQPVVPQLVAAEPYPSDHRSFYSSQIPSVFFTTGRYVEHDTCRDTPSILQYADMEAELEYIYNFTRLLSNVQSAPSFLQREKQEAKEDERVYAFYDCDYSPAFMGRHDPRWFLETWVYKYMKYPKEALEEGIQGKVTVYFEVDKKGRVRNARVVKGCDEYLDAEALKVINASPDWKPARLAGKKVNSSMELTIEFRLEKRENRRGIKLKR